MREYEIPWYLGTLDHIGNFYIIYINMREYEIPWYLGTLDHIGKIEFYIGTFERVPSYLGTHFYKLLHCNILSF